MELCVVKIFYKVFSFLDNSVLIPYLEANSLALIVRKVYHRKVQVCTLYSLYTI